MHRSSKKFMPTYVLIALNVGVYVFTSIVGGNFIETDYNLILQYGQLNWAVFYYGWYWQLVTSMFVHGNIVHIFGNMFFLLIFGLRAEELFSLEEYLLIYLLSGLTGNVLSLLFGPLAPPSLGASGAIFGLFGACTIYLRRSIGQSIIGAIVVSFILLLISSGPEVNNLAHLGGLAFGLIAGYALAATRKPAKPSEYGYSYSTQA
jgi:rhomboid protease GluP